MNTTPVPNRVIAASAGSGKTHQLALRYLLLLSAGVAPERIVALTFSRKAAGEILQRIVQQLCAWHGRPDVFPGEAAAAGVPLPALGRPDLIRLLRRLLLSLHRLRVGTLDSFFVGVVNAFPLEFGLAGALRIVDDGSAAQTRRRVLRRLLFGAGAAKDAEAFLREFSLASGGNAERGLGEQMDEFAQHAHETILRLPDAAQWGDRRTLWPGGLDLLDRPADGAAAAGGLTPERLASAPGKRGDKQRAKLTAFLDEAARLRHFAGLSKAGRELYRKLLAIYPDLGCGDATLVVEAAIRLAPGDGAALRELTRHLMRLELTGRLDNTAGVHGIVSRYERAYDETVRAAGALTFSDITRLLAGGCRGQGALSGAVSGPDRLYIDYRLDGHFDHWLLDEFQDTSLSQWCVIRNLVDELMQAPAGEKTFFYVGDVKQSIYGWRGGEPALFEGVYADLSRRFGEAALERGSLTVCRRSGPEVVAAVNRVFGAVCAAHWPASVRLLLERTGDDARAGAVLRGAAEQFRWEEHRSAGGGPGRVELIEAPDAGDGDAEDGLSASPKARVIAGVLRRLKPFERAESGRALSVAVLTRTNRAAASLAAELDTLGIRTAVEGSFAIHDNPVVAAFASLARLAEHPRDTFAIEHLRMSPLAPYVADEAAARRLSGELLADVHAGGFAGLVRKWAARLRPLAPPPDAFARSRLDALEGAARDFDASGSRNALEFVAYLSECKVPSTAGEGVVQVMTVHKAKGLGFSVVFLPELDGGDVLKCRADGLQEKRADGGLRADWCLFPPGRDLMALVPPLDACCREWDTANAFESLCVLYVGMTRAARALYLVVDEPPRKGAIVRTSDLARLLADGVLPEAGGEAMPEGARRLYAEGDADWAARLPLRAGAAEPEPAARPAVRFEGLRRRRTPSGEEAAPAAPRGLFAPARGRGRELGSYVHELMQRVAWWSPDFDAAGLAAAWLREAGPADDPARREAIELFRAALAMPGVQGELSRPLGGAELWCERRFDLILDGAWISGVFDRVTFTRDGKGRPASATILDFKTDDVSGAEAMRQRVEVYRGQMQAYRRVAQVLLGLRADRVACRLLFVRAGETADV